MDRQTLGLTTDRWTEGQMNRHTYKSSDRLEDRRRDKQTDKEKDKLRELLIYK